MAIIESELKMTDLIDVESLQKIQDAFSDMSGIASMITDASGTIQTKPSGFTDFAKYTSATPRKGGNGASCAISWEWRGPRRRAAPALTFATPGLWSLRRPLWRTGTWWDALSEDRC